MKDKDAHYETEDEFIAENLEFIGKRLKQLRIAKGYTSYDVFAYEHEISRSQYGKYERGVDLRLSTLLRLIYAHDLTLQEFFAGLKR